MWALHFFENRLQLNERRGNFQALCSVRDHIGELRKFKDTRRLVVGQLEKDAQSIVGNTYIRAFLT